MRLGHVIMSTGREAPSAFCRRRSVAGWTPSCSAALAKVAAVHPRYRRLVIPGLLAALLVIVVIAAILG